MCLKGEIEKMANFFFCKLILFLSLGAQIAAVPALVSCNSAFATCMAACSAAVVLPTP